MKTFLIVILVVFVTTVFFDSCKTTKVVTVPGESERKSTVNTDDSDTLTVRYWPKSITPGDFIFPEISDEELKYTPILNRPNCGICISGGGTVSASLSTGYLQALGKLKLVKNLRYISGVSGGTWGSAPYCFLPSNITDNHFLGPKFLPSAITPQSLEYIPPQSMTYAVTHAPIGDLTGEYLLEGYGHASYNRAVGKIFLDPFGIKFFDKYFSTDQNAVAKIIARNPHLTPDDFVTLRQDRPYPVMGATIYVPISNPNPICQDPSYKIYPFEFTPLYSGAKTVHRGIADQLIGGVFVESFGFDTLNPVSAGPGIVKVTPGKRRFALCDPVGTSGAAPLSAMPEWLREILDQAYPEFNYWNPFDSNLSNTQIYKFRDGGIIEDTGIVSLLNRGVKNIAVFLTSPFDTTSPINPDDEGEMFERYFGYNQVACLFGQKIYCLRKGPHYKKLITDPFKRTIFMPSQFEGLKNKLIQAKKDGGPIFVKGTYTTVTNNLFGVQGEKQYKIIWMCVDTCAKWTDQLPPWLKSQIGVPGGELDDFPVVKVFLQNNSYLIQLTSKQANLLGDLAYWMVLGDSPHSPQAKAFIDVLGGDSQ